jgi:Fe-S-cluster containining protein
MMNQVLPTNCEVLHACCNARSFRATDAEWEELKRRVPNRLRWAIRRFRKFGNLAEEEFEGRACPMRKGGCIIYEYRPAYCRKAEPKRGAEIHYINCLLTESKNLTQIVESELKRGREGGMQKARDRGGSRNVGVGVGGVGQDNDVGGKMPRRGDSEFYPPCQATARGHRD